VTLGKCSLKSVSLTDGYYIDTTVPAPTDYNNYAHLLFIDGITRDSGEVLTEICFPQLPLCPATPTNMPTERAATSTGMLLDFCDHGGLATIHECKIIFIHNEKLILSIFLPKPFNSSNHNSYSSLPHMGPHGCTYRGPNHPPNCGNRRCTYQCAHCSSNA
jgi:hypothetical protein